jgi:prepilin-type processing-associated H-X9-DG protein
MSQLLGIVTAVSRHSGGANTLFADGLFLSLRTRSRLLPGARWGLEQVMT